MSSTHETYSPRAVLSRDSLRVLRTSPWKAFNTLERLLLLPLIRGSFWWCGIAWGQGWRIYGLPILQRHQQSRIVLGDYLELRSTVRSNPLGPSHPVILSTRRPAALLQVGDHFSMTGGSIVAEEKITIGNHVAVGCNSTIIDTDFHPLDPIYRQEHPLDAETAPITIGDHVFIGMNSLILKGVSIGENTVIGAGSVVTRSLPANVIAAGNPAKVLRPLQIDEKKYGIANSLNPHA
jgi:acetyltransferase-like isoleucine patch superfamily enzyme